MNPSTPSATSAAADRDTSAGTDVALRFDPPLSEWVHAAPPRRDDATWREMIALSNRWTHLPGTAALAQRDALIGTGHQAWLWHPGILAKDVAARFFASRHDFAWVHLVVDHDVSDAATLPVPVREGDALRVELLTLGRTMADVPTGCQPAIASDEAVAAVDAFAQRWGDRLAVDLQPLRDALRAGEHARTLAEQMTATHVHVMQPLVGPTAVIGSAGLFTLSAARDMLADILADPFACISAYNAAVHAQPEAGIAPLHAGVDIVELPLWSLQWQQPRQRVFAAIAGARADLITGDGTAIDLDSDGMRLAPKALMLTAVMRSAVTDLFIHGAGGGVYDRVMASWWQRWRGQTVAPMAVASADVRLPFDVPVNTSADRERAMWYAHHLPHNVDRHLRIDGEEALLVEEKRSLLAHMDDDRDRHRRAASFARLHAINDELASHHIDAISHANQQVDASTRGVINRTIAQRRDWPLQWYTDDALLRLRDAVKGAVVG